MKRLGGIAIWTAIAIGGAIALGKIALYRGEAISAQTVTENAFFILACWIE